LKIANWNLNRQGVLDFSKLNQNRLKAFHNLDVRVDKKYFYKNLTLNFYVDIQNLYNFQSELPPILDVVKDDNGNALVNPNDNSSYLGKTIQNTSGTLLPSIGIVVEF